MPRPQKGLAEGQGVILQMWDRWWVLESDSLGYSEALITTLAVHWQQSPPHPERSEHRHQTGRYKVAGVALVQAEVLPEERSIEMQLLRMGPEQMHQSLRCDLSLPADEQGEQQEGPEPN